MADGGEEEPAMEGEGEAPPGQDSGASKEPSLPYCYSIALLAGEGVKIEDLQGQLEGFSGAGFKIVTREDIEGAAGEDEELAAALAACKEADPPNPIPPDVYAKLLKNLLGEAAPAEPPALSAEGPVGKLIQVDKGPRCFKVFINDFPLRQDMPTLEASLEGGTLDLVVLVTAPPPPPPLPPADGEEAAAEPPPEPSEEEKAATEQLLAEGRAREKLFADFQEFVRVETTAQSGRCSHKLVANVCFDTLELVASDPAAGTYCDAEASMEALGRKMLQIIQAKFEWMGYMAPLQRIETQAEEINMRHYHQVLSAGPPSTVSVALILNALIEQVERLHPDMDNTCLSVAKRGFATASAPTDCAQPPHHHPDVAERVNNLKIEDALEEALYTLNAELPKRNNLELPNRRMDIPLVLQGDKQSQRIGAPKVPQTQRDSWVAKEQAVNDLLDAVVRARVPAMHPEEPGMTEAEIGLEMTELVTMLPDTLSPSQIKRGLVLAEMERLVNFITDDKGDAINVNAWFMEEISLAPYTMVEEHGPEALKQILREAFEAPHGINPTVKATYYAREDLILALVCNHVPFSRQQNLVWKAVNRGETSVRCFLGFWQWLETRFVFRKEDNDAREAEQRALLAEQEAGMDSIGAVKEEQGEEEAEEGAAPEEVSEEELERRRIEAEEKEAEALRLEQLKEALPELALPRSGTWYEMDAKKALRIQESRDVCFLSHGPRVCMTKVGQQRILTVDAARHTLVMRQDQDDTFKLTLTYEDGACAMARREDGQTVVSVSMPEGLMVTLRSDGTVWQSRPKSKPVEGVDKAAEQKRLDWAAHAAKMDMVPKPKGQLTVEGDVALSVADRAAVTSCALVGEGNVVLWRADGECEIQMPNSCCAESLGPGCGWLWTNSKGQRQIRGAPKARAPVPAPPVKVEKRAQPESGDIMVSRGDFVLTVTRRDGTELVMHRDGSEMVTYPAGPDDHGPRRNIKIMGMAPIETGPSPRQTCVTMQDGSTLCLIPALGGGPGFIELRRRDGSVLTVSVKGGKVVLIAEGEPIDLASEQGSAADSKSKKSGVSKGKSAADAQSVKSGRSKAPDDAASARQGAGSVKSVKSNKTSKTEEAHDDKSAGTYSMSLITGSMLTSDHGGNTYSITSNGEVKVTNQAQLALKKRNADAISAADEARNKMAMEASGGMEDLRPPSPKIEAEPSARLEPYRLFVLRRDGSGYELVHERIARFLIRTAAQHGRSVVEEPLPPEDEEAGAVSYTVLAPDHRYPLGGSAAGIKLLSDDLMPPLIKHKGLSSGTDPGTVGGKPAPWTRLVLQKLVYYPPLAKEIMVLLRRSLQTHAEWREEQDQIGDAHYLADVRSQETMRLEKSVQERIVEARKGAHVMPANFRRKSTKNVGGMSPTHAGGMSSLSSAAPRGSVTFPHAEHAKAQGAYPQAEAPFARGPPRAAMTDKQTPDSLSIHPGSASEMRPATQGTGMPDDESSEEEDAPGRGIVFRSYPPVVKFGEVPAGCVYRYKLTILNAGVDYSKYRIRQPKLSNVSVIYTPCQVAAGMSVVVWVEISAPVAGVTIKDAFSIVSEVKDDTFQVPIYASVVEAGELPPPGVCLDEAGHVEVVEHIAKTVTLSTLRSKPPPVVSGNKFLKRADGTTLAGTLSDVQHTGKQVKKKKTLIAAGIPVD